MERWRVKSLEPGFQKTILRNEVLIMIVEEKNIEQKCSVCGKMYKTESTFVNEYCVGKYAICSECRKNEKYLEQMLSELNK